MTMNPRDPLHRGRSVKPGWLIPNDAAKEAPKTGALDLTNADYFDKPGELPKTKKISVEQD